MTATYEGFNVFVFSKSKLMNNERQCIELLLILLKLITSIFILNSTFHLLKCGKTINFFKYIRQHSDNITGQSCILISFILKICT